MTGKASRKVKTEKNQSQDDHLDINRKMLSDTENKKLSQHEAIEDNAVENEEQNHKENDFYIALSHDIRRKIIKIIGDNESAGFSDFKRETEASTGTIYHHLDLLENIIIQDSKKKYHLTILGQHAYRFLNQNLDSIASTKTTESLQINAKKHKIIDYILFKRLFQITIDQPRIGFIFSLIIMSTIGLLCALFNIQQYLFFYITNQSSFEETIIPIQLRIFLYAILGYFILFLITEALCRFLFGKNENWDSLLGTLGISYIPMLVYLICIIILGYTPLSHLVFFPKVLLIIFQVWAMILVSYGISLTKFIRFERGLVIAIFINYGTFMVLIISNIKLF